MDPAKGHDHLVTRTDRHEDRARHDPVALLLQVHEAVAGPELVDLRVAQLRSELAGVTMPLAPQPLSPETTVVVDDGAVQERLVDESGVVLDTADVHVDRVEVIRSARSRIREGCAHVREVAPLTIGMDDVAAERERQRLTVEGEVEPGDRP